MVKVVTMKTDDRELEIRVTPLGYDVQSTSEYGSEGFITSDATDVLVEAKRLFGGITGRLERALYNKLID
ncbi:MAG: hypothetical protein ACRC5C_13175 [Bacilli bacterium]